MKPLWGDIKALIQLRNSLANHLRAVDGIFPIIIGDISALFGSILTGKVNMNLPPLLKSDYPCRYCYQASECMMYHAAFEGSVCFSDAFNCLIPSTKVEQLRRREFQICFLMCRRISAREIWNTSSSENMVTRVCSQPYLMFLSRWNKLIDLEFMATESEKSPLWLLPGAEREERGMKW